MSRFPEDFRAYFEYGPSFPRSRFPYVPYMVAPLVPAARRSGVPAIAAQAGLSPAPRVAPPPARPVTSWLRCPRRHARRASVYLAYQFTFFQVPSPFLPPLCLLPSLSLRWMVALTFCA